MSDFIVVQDAATVQRCTLCERSLLSSPASTTSTTTASASTDASEPVEEETDGAPAASSSSSSGSEKIDTAVVVIRLNQTVHTRLMQLSTPVLVQKTEVQKNSSSQSVDLQKTEEQVFVAHVHTGECLKELLRRVAVFKKEDEKRHSAELAKQVLSPQVRGVSESAHTWLHGMSSAYIRSGVAVTQLSPAIGAVASCYSMGYKLLLPPQSTCAILPKESAKVVGADASCWCPATLFLTAYQVLPFDIEVRQKQDSEPSTLNWLTILSHLLNVVRLRWSGHKKSDVQVQLVSAARLPVLVPIGTPVRLYFVVSYNGFDKASQQVVAGNTRDVSFKHTVQWADVHSKPDFLAARNEVDVFVSCIAAHVKTALITSSSSFEDGAWELKLTPIAPTPVRFGISTQESESGMTVAVNCSLENEQLACVFASNKMFAGAKLSSKYEHHFSHNTIAGIDQKRTPEYAVAVLQASTTLAPTTTFIDSSDSFVNLCKVYSNAHFMSLRV